MSSTEVNRMNEPVQLHVILDQVLKNLPLTPLPTVAENQVAQIKEMLKTGPYARQVFLLYEKEGELPEAKWSSKYKRLNTYQKAIYLLMAIQGFHTAVGSNFHNIHHEFYKDLQNYCLALKAYAVQVGREKFPRPSYKMVWPDLFSNIVTCKEVDNSMDQNAIKHWMHKSGVRLYRSCERAIYYYHFKNEHIEIFKSYRKGHMTQPLTYTVTHMLMRLMGRVVWRTPRVGHSIMQEVTAPPKNQKQLHMQLTLEEQEDHPHNPINTLGVSENISEQEVPPDTLSPPKQETKIMTDQLALNLEQPTHPLVSARAVDFDDLHDLVKNRPSRHLVKKVTVKEPYDPAKDENLPTDFRSAAKALDHSGEEKIAKLVKELYQTWQKARLTQPPKGSRVHLRSTAQKLVEELTQLKKKQVAGNSEYLSDSIFVLTKHFIHVKVNTKINTPVSTKEI